MTEQRTHRPSHGPDSRPARGAPGAAGAFTGNAAAELLNDGSVELSFGGAADVAPAAAVLPYSTPVMVPHTGRRPLGSGLELLRAIREAGLDPVPHVAARAVGTEAELESFLQAAVGEYGVHRVVLVGGDAARPAGPFADSLAVLSSGVLQRAGVREAGFAGYPEGHPSLPPDQALGCLREKLALAAATGLGAHVITQFSLLPGRILEFCAALASAAPDVPVYAGIPGPCTNRQLLHFARRCGVSASLAAVGKVGVRVAQVSEHYEPEHQLGLLAHYYDSHPGCCLVGVHVFSFGGFDLTARWIAGHR